MWDVVISYFILGGNGMYLIKAGERIIYDSTDKNTYPVLSPQFDDELNGAGTMSFTVIPGHPYYDNMKEMQTFVAAYRDDEELFYGRILSTDREIDGRLLVDCEGGLTFFMDTEMSKATYNETCQAFLTRILQNHNSMVEPAKQFTLGTVNVAKAIAVDEETHQVKKWKFEISGFASTKSVLESLVLGQFGGYFRTRSDGNGGHILDYLEDYGRTNTQPVRIGHNIVDKKDKISGENIFTVLRPIFGKNKTISNLTQADVTLPNVTKDGEWLYLDDMIEEYGYIYHTEAFEKAQNARECLAKAEEFITDKGSQLPASTEIGFVDFYHLNNKNLLNINPQNHNAWAYYNIPNTLVSSTKYIFSINGNTEYGYALWLANAQGSTRRLAVQQLSGGSIEFTTPSDMTEPYLVLDGSEEGAGNEDLDDILPMLINSIDVIKLGDVFTNINEFEGTTLTVGSIHLDFENPGNDTMTLKNKEELSGDGPTSNSLSIIESKYAIADAFRYHYINENWSSVDGYLQLWGPKIDIDTKMLQAIGNKTYICAEVDPDDPTSGELKLIGLKYNQMPTDPDAQYNPTVLVTLGGVKLSATGEFVDEATGSTFATTSALTVEGNSIRAQVNAESERAQRQEASLQLEVTEQGAAITSKVSAGDIASAINQTAQSVLIQASKINLSGFVTMDSFEAQSAVIEDITSNGLTNVNHIIATAGVFSGLTIAGETAEWHTLNWNMGMDSTSVIAYKNIRLGHYHTFSVTEADGVVSLSLGIPTTTDPGTQTFNIADTAFYQQAVSAAHAAGVQEGAASMSVDSISAGITSVASITYNGSNLSVPLTLTAYHDDGGSGSIVGSDTQSLTVPSRVSSTTTITYDPSTHTYYAASVSKILDVTAATSDVTSNTDAYTDGVDSVTVSSIVVDSTTWSNDNFNVTLTASATNGEELSDTKQIAAAVTSSTSISYNTSTHTYYASSSAKLNGTERATSNATSGTQAYTAGQSSVDISSIVKNSQSYNNGNFTVNVTASATNGATKDANISVTGTAAYNAGWNDCRTTTLNTSERLRVVDSTETVYDEWGNRYTALTGSHWANFYTVPAAK